MSGVRLCSVVKADAYGHGAEAVAFALSEEADMFAVALAEEAKAIRLAACGKPILVLTPPTEEKQAEELIKNGFMISVSGLRTARLVVSCVEKTGLTVSVHLQVNTGMNRYGMNLSDLGKVCRLLKAYPSVNVQGVYSHLYTHSLTESEKQRLLFLRAEKICRRYYPSVIAHLGATYGALLGKEFAFDMVRVGIGLYGYLPEGKDELVRKRLRLKKAMRVYAQVVQSRKYSSGGAGYGFLDEETKKTLSSVSAVRVGYADGFFRKRDNGMADAEKNLSPLCMDVCMQTGKIEAGRYVTIMKDADETAEKAGTISYEILCSVTRRAEFVYEYR